MKKRSSGRSLGKMRIKGTDLNLKEFADYQAIKKKLSIKYKK